MSVVRPILLVCADDVRAHQGSRTSAIIGLARSASIP